jgi:hypothetical protein
MASKRRTGCSKWRAKRNRLWLKVAYYPVTEQQLLELIDRHSGTWRTRAAALARQNIDAAKLVQKKSLWGEIKAVYSLIQSDKCIYCELQLGGSATQDVEHYRPKAKVTKWPRKPVKSINFPVGSHSSTGYYWLTYEPKNYAASCAHCNSSLKSNGFPIAGQRQNSGGDVSALNAIERPLLLLPFGEWGDDIGHYIEFYGITPKPRSGLSDEDRRRAIVTIEFFRLDKEVHLLNLRRQVIVSVWRFCSARQNASNPAERTAAQRDIDLLTARRAPQSLCARSFERMMTRDPVNATIIYEQARSYLESINELPFG